jgi:PAS domain S-box-containing protein
MRVERGIMDSKGHPIKRLKRSLSTSTRICLGSLFLTLVGTGIAAYWNFLHYADKERWVEHTHEVIEVSETLLSSLKDSETGQRGYLLTADLNYLMPYNQSQLYIRTALQRLKHLTQDNPEQRSEVARLNSLVDKKVQELQQTIALKKTKQSQAALNIVLQHRGKALMDEIRQTITLLEQRERMLLAQRVELKRLAARQITLMLGFAVLASTLLIILLVLLFLNAIQRQREQVQNIEKIERSRKALANTLESITDGFVSLDENWIYTYVNRKAGEILGRLPESLLGKNIWEEFPEGIGQPFYMTYYKVMQKRQPEQIEAYYPPWDKWYENRIYPSVRGITIFFQDITDAKRSVAELQLYREHLETLVEQRTTELTVVNLQLQQELRERQHAEAALARSERYFRTITENSVDLIIRHDRAFNFLYVNPVFVSLTGTPAEDWIGKNLVDMGFPDEITQQIVNACEAVFETGQVGILEHQAPSPQGWRTFQSFMVPEFDNRRDVESILISARDVTDIKEREASLKEVERRWRYLLDNVRLVVVGLDRNGNVDYVNPFCLELTGYEAAEVIGHPWFETFLPKSQLPSIRKVFQEFIDQEFHAHYQNPIVTKGGKERTIAWNNTQLHNSQGEVIGSMSIGEDITERVALDRVKAEFIAMVSHELRTPITSIQGALNLLIEGIVPTESPRWHEVLEIAADGADRLVTIVNDILDLERLESGRISLTLRSCQTTVLMTQAVDSMQVLADQVKVALKTMPQPYTFLGDGDRLIQVITNLLSNAIKFSPSGSTVWLGVEQDTDLGNLRFWVQDEGRGIPSEQLERIFERFHQVNATDARQKGGTGLGLPICRIIIQQHGGTIWAESKVGQGSRFYFTIPLQPY